MKNTATTVIVFVGILAALTQAPHDGMLVGLPAHRLVLPAFFS